MALPSKTIRCACGETLSMTTRKLMCTACGKYVFYDDNERRRHRRGLMYIVAMLALGMGFLTYLFIEMVVTPMFMIR
jgi:hypothetical protein